MVKKHVIDNRPLKYVVIAARYKDEWLFVRHKERTTWETPGGHIEDETPDEAASRELYEETGAIEFSIIPVYDYSVTREEATYGRLYYAEIEALGDLPESEIAEVHPLNESMKWTYDKIQPILIQYIQEWLDD